MLTEPEIRRLRDRLQEQVDTAPSRRPAMGEDPVRYECETIDRAKLDTLRLVLGEITEERW